MLPVDPERGYPVPWFVLWIDGKPEFRVMDTTKWKRAVKERLCWVCGRALGSYLAFVLGPMCGITRTTSEPPCHLDCARWSARNCPFLTKPQMTRREDEAFLALDPHPTGGLAIKRNPGVVLIWITQTYQLFKPVDGGVLITVGPPIEVEWWAQGRPASWCAVNDSVMSGLPLLEEEARKEEGAMEALYKEVDMLKDLYPRQQEK
jgi:hypothetical protein